MERVQSIEFRDEVDQLRDVAGVHQGIVSEESDAAPVAVVESPVDLTQGVPLSVPRE